MSTLFKKLFCIVLPIHVAVLGLSQANGQSQVSYRFQGTIKDPSNQSVQGYLRVKKTVGGFAFGEPVAIGSNGEFDLYYSIQGIASDEGRVCLGYFVDASPPASSSSFDANLLMCLDYDKGNYSTPRNSSDFILKDDYGFNLETRELPSEGNRVWCGMRFVKVPNVDVFQQKNAFLYDGSRAWCPESYEKLNTIVSSTYTVGNLVSNGSFEGSYTDNPWLPHPHWNSDYLRRPLGSYNLFEYPASELKPVDGERMATVVLYGDMSQNGITPESGYLESERFPVVPGTFYQLAFHYARKSIPQEQTGDVRPVVRFYESKTSSELGGGALRFSGQLYAQATNDWTFYSTSLPVPEGANYARLELVSRANTTIGGKFYFDNVVVAPGSVGELLYYATEYRGPSSTSFVDGLNHPIQTRIRRTYWEDVYSAIELDDLHRPSKATLPLLVPDWGIPSYSGYISDLFARANSFYSGSYGGDAGGYPYSQTIYEDNILGRPFLQAFPGASWNVGAHTARTVRFGSSDLNLPTDLPSILEEGTAKYSFEVNFNPENKVTRSISDKFGRVIRTGVNDGTAWINSDFEYDPNGNLVKQIAPAGPGGFRTETVKQYNTLGQLLSEESPDYGKNLFMYDSRGRLRFTQSQVQRNSTPQRFSYSKYDDFNRIVETGESIDGAAFTEGNADIQDFPMKIDLRTLPRTFNFYDRLPQNKNYCEETSGALNLVVRADANPAVSTEFSTLGAAYTWISTYLSELSQFWGQVKIINVFENDSELSTPPIGLEFLPIPLLNPANKVSFTISGILKDSEEYDAVVGKDFPFMTHADYQDRLVGTITCNVDMIGEAAGMKQIAKYFDYDKYGNVTDEYEYNGYVKSEIDRWEHTSYRYNLAGQLTDKLFYRDVRDFFPIRFYSYEYNLQGDLERVTQDDGEDLRRVAQFNYDAMGLPWEKFVGVGFNHAALYTNAYYNIRGWPTYSITYGPSIAPTSTGVVLEEDLRYDWGPNAKYDGNISNYIYTDKDGNRRQWSYFYDPMNRLKNAFLNVNMNPTAEVFSYSYFKNGAINSVTKYGNQYTYKYESYQNQANQTVKSNRLANVVSSGPYTRDTHWDNNFQYDASGRMTVDLSKNMNVDFGDHDRPFYFNYVGGVGNSNHVDYMVYDGLGNRKSKISYVNGAWYTSTHYMGDGKEIKEFSAAAPQVFYPYDNYGKARLTTSGFELPEVYVRNYLGSTIYAINPNTQSYSYQTEYEPYGKLRNQVVGPDASVTEKFTGKEHDEGIDLDYFGARYYDSDLGVWISPDAMRQFHSPHAYSANPVNTVDPDGNVAAFIATGVANVGVGYALAAVTGGTYTPVNAAADFASGALVIGLISNGTKLAKIGWRMGKTKLAMNGAGARRARILNNEQVALKNAGKEIIKNGIIIEGLGEGSEAFAEKIEEDNGLNYDLTGWLKNATVAEDVDLGPAPRDAVMVDEKR